MNKYVLSGLGGLAAGILIALIVMNVAVPTTIASDNPTVGVVLVIDVYDKYGNLKQHYVKEGDLLLKNWIALQQYWFERNADADTGVYVIATGGATKDYDYFCQTGGASPYKAVILLGNGTTAPVVDDYTLNSEVANFEISGVSITFSGNDMNLSITGSWVSDASYNISEIGLKIKISHNLPGDSGHTEYWVLVFRDVLATTIQLQSGDTISITYTLVYDNP
jgi:hypothetical protein